MREEVTKISFELTILFAFKHKYSLGTIFCDSLFTQHFIGKQKKL